MKNVNLQIVNTTGEVIQEQMLELQEGSTVVVQMPEQYYDIPEMIEAMVQAFSHTGEGRPIFIPEDVKLSVINVK